MFGFLAMVCIIQCGMTVYGAKDQSELFFNLAKRSSCTQPSLTVTSYSDLADFNEQMKEWHNYFRCCHGSDDVTIDDGLVASAQAWADSMAATGTFGHSDNRCGVGENVFAAWYVDDLQLPAWKVVRGDATRSNYGYGWYCSEYSDFDFNTHSYQSGTGHFTQVVWKDSTKLGCGVKKSGIKTYVACQYSPGGNIGTSFCWNDYAVLDLQNGIAADTVCPSTNS